jgi:hypothetical protein
MDFKSVLSDYTENEFLEIIKTLFDASYSSEEELDSIVHHVVAVSEHPMGTDVLFYPDEKYEDSPQGVLNAIKEWRIQNGRPGFKVG